MKTIKKDRVFSLILTTSAFLVTSLVFVFFITLLYGSFPVIKKLGISFIFEKTWDPYNNQFGIIPFIVGTLFTSFLALIISLPFSLSIAILTGEYLKDSFLATLLKSLVEILAGIPSVIYGFWALSFLVPIMTDIEIKLGVIPYGVGILTASLVLAIMIIPYSASIGRDSIKSVPDELKQGAYALGATRFETLKNVIFPYSFSGIFTGLMLALGRAIGETMAVTMVIGNMNEVPKSIFDSANSMASVIANEFTEATADIHRSALIAIGLVLFIISFVISIIGRKIVAKRMRV